MKKVFSLLLIMLLAAGCHKKQNLQKDLTGTWTVYKYLLYSADDTQQFTAKYGTYTITFNGHGNFVRSVTVPDSTSTSGSYYFTDNNEQMVLVDSTYISVDTVNVPVVNQELYTLFDVTSVSMELFTDSSALYLDKKQ